VFVPSVGTILTKLPDGKDKQRRIRFMATHIDARALEAIKALQRPGRPDLLSRIVDLFVTESPKLISTIMQGTGATDLEAVRTAAHTLKSSSAYVGARQVSERCKDLESAAREGNALECVSLSHCLEADYDAACAELQQVMDKAA